MNENTLFNIEKKYHFYAAHRNHTLSDKCSNLHGHTYYLTTTFQSEITDHGVSLLFADIDNVMDIIVKNLDHGLLICKDDPFLSYVDAFNKANFGNNESAGLKMTIMQKESSVEYLCEFLRDAILTTPLGSLLKKISIQETTSSIVTLEIPS